MCVCVCMCVCVYVCVCVCVCLSVSVSVGLVSATLVESCPEFICFLPGPVRQTKERK